VTEYNTLKTALNATLRKQGGSLSVRDITTLVKPSHLVDSENLTTLFVVVSKFGLQEWTANYETMTKYVVCGRVQEGWWWWRRVEVLHGGACVPGPEGAMHVCCNNLDSPAATKLQIGYKRCVIRCVRCAVKYRQLGATTCGMPPP
jgi:hypothetical protein